ncbi:hypothetical protein E5K00_10270 [Hymenobacter aquaticus]|uniref:Uncharacterized protein n=1 Tax=Hymenobacter aquaticus TaxID=1867101 RepID=A0A4Z0Q7Z0_9BACT|nr:DUF6348 family protein [Hymenobacter aquaticus]TGE25546.1 hypothetical protein E5K00_10270 [Hymenobacter aquaticus]
MPDVNAQLQSLFQQHDISTIALDDKVLLLTKQPALLQSRVTPRQFPNGATSQLDVRLFIKDQVLVESFGDIGETAEAALTNNLANFARNSLHVLLAALQSAEQDEQVSVEDWHINGSRWQAYVGNYGIKAAKGQLVPVPAELFPRLEGIIHGLPLTQNYHWFRFFVSSNDAQISNLEVLFDNHPLPAAEQEFVNFNWPLIPEFYSIRLFLVLRKVA